MLCAEVIDERLLHAVWAVYFARAEESQWPALLQPVSHPGGKSTYYF
ncbi:MAG: hypothetical protein K6U04_04485 [Armatimonadetes bacterium]|nr:hypothetical protein [Armatimonadota bacterium]